MRTLKQGEAQAEFERLLVIESDNCVVWTGYTRPNGKSTYGWIRQGNRTVSVHSLALERRVGPRPDGHEAAHAPMICHNSLCMNYRHLRWATRRENKADMVLDCTRLSGEDHGRARLSWDQVREIRQRASAGEQMSALASTFGVGRSTVGHIIAGRTWQEVEHAGS